VGDQAQHRRLVVGSMAASAVCLDEYVTRQNRWCRAGLSTILQETLTLAQPGDGARERGAQYYA